ncbi:hypothetical protein NPIL_558501 [Nephila pilipes]|uniref:Uncharacterized protein n=1 Tax=Nephila pilipes TaxID=299642 RepID=A0A8X6T733_NEPPI|nr:hypothetical protein NPIL_558501 [Nephila pilipes]
MDTFSASNGWNFIISSSSSSWRFKIRHDDDNVDEEWLRATKVVFTLKFSDYISIDQYIVTCGILGIEEMCDDAKNKNNGEEAEDKVHSDEGEPTPVQSLSDAITTFETVQTFIYIHEITEKNYKKCCKSYKFAI